MRSYGQYCPLAKTLDVVGDRWSLLIVRELMIRGPSRYTDIRNGLPGVATNLLADRLRELEQAGVVRRGRRTAQAIRVPHHGPELPHAELFPAATDTQRLVD